MHEPVSRVKTLWDSPIQSAEVVDSIKTLLGDIVKVKTNYIHQSRACVPEGFEMDLLIGLSDGGIEAYGASLYVRSVLSSGELACNLAAARAKVSSLDVGDNELSASLLEARLAEVVVGSIPEKPPSLRVALITDSQCTGHSHNDEFSFAERRRNIGVRFHRSIRRLHAQNDSLEILLVWLPGVNNPADLISKVHEDVDVAINSSFWRNGSPLYTDKHLPNVPNAVIYGVLKGEVYKHLGFPNTSQHLAQCFSCSTHIDAGPRVASELLLHGQILCFDTQMSIPDKAPLTEPAPAGVPPGRDELFASFNDISGLVKCGVIATTWVRKTRDKTADSVSTQGGEPRQASDVIDKCRVWTRLVATSQGLYKPQNIKQLLPQINKFGGAEFLGTQNRLNPYNVARYHRTPLGVLPLISHKDKALVDLLIKSTHVTNTYISGEKVHLNKNQTISAIRSGFFGSHVTKLGPSVASFIKRCTMCQRMKACLQPHVISDKFILRFDSPESGVFSSIGIDILGAYKFKMGPGTRSNKVNKAYVLLLCCQFTSALNCVVMEDYSTKSFLKAFKTHVAQFRKPAIISCDARSQFRSVAARTRSKNQEQVSGAETDETLPNIFDRIQSTLKDIRFFVAPSGAQWCNGLVESNFREVKVVLRKLTAHFGANNVVFKSSFELSKLFNDDAYISVKSLVCPCFNTDNLDQILADTDSAFKTFLEHFDQLIITGNFQKFGGHSATKTCNLQKGDFVLVIFESQKKRCFGIIQNTPVKSKHIVDVKILRRRNAGDNLDFLPKIESFSTRQVKLIHREK